MSGFGIGIGSFVGGLTKGIEARQRWDQQELDNKLAERKLQMLERGQSFDQDMATKKFGLEERKELTDTEIRKRQLQLLEGKDARDARADDFDLRKRKADFGFEQQERAADAPLRAAKRRSVMQGFNDEQEQRQTLRDAATGARQSYDEQRAKSIVTGKDAAGNPTYSVDGQQAASKGDADKMFEQRHGSFMDNYRTKMVPRIVEGYLKRGDTQGAAAYEKWSQMEGIQSAIHSYGRMMQSFELGDWDGVNRHLGEMFKNGDYVSTDRHDISAEPITKDGKTAGITIKYKDKVTGAESKRDFTDLNEFHRFAGVIASPDAVFEHNRQEMLERAKAQNERAKEKEKLASELMRDQAKNELDMDRDRAQSALRIDEEKVKEAGPAGEARRIAGIAAVRNMLEESNAFLKSDENGKSVRMTPEEQERLVEETYLKNIAAGRKNAAQGATPPAMPGRAIVQQPQAPLAAPAPARRVLPPMW